MKRTRRLSLAAALLPFGAVWSPAVEPEEGWERAVAVDFLAVGNAPGRNRDYATRACASLAGCSSSVESSGAFGVRTRFFEDDVDTRKGVSVGYLFGGPTAGKLQARTPGGGALDKSTANHTFRLLGELSRVFELNDRWEASLGGAGGSAMVAEAVSCSDSLQLTGGCGKRGTIWGYYTWELAATIGYRRLEAAVRYAGFARGGFVPWHTYGVSLAGRF